MARKKIDLSINPLSVGPSLLARTTSGSPYREISLDEIDSDPDQPRKQFESESLESLADSIKQYGVMSPILIRMTAPGGSYRVVSGERRYRASKLAGLDTIPAIIEAEDEEEARTRAKQLVENIQRENLNSLDKALAIGQLKESHDLSIREISTRLGISKAMVQRSLEVLSLPEDLKLALSQGGSESKILCLKKVKDPLVRRELLSRIDNYTRVQLEEAIDALSKTANSKEVYHGGTAEKVKRHKELSSEDKRFIEDLQSKLGLKIRILRKSGKNNQGRVVMDFYSKDDLKRLYELLIAS